MHRWIEHEVNVCHAVHNNAAREFQGRKTKESDERQKKIFGKLQKKNGVHFIAEVVAEHQKQKRDLEHKMEENETKNSTGI